jgi:hypothetical protein
MVSISTTVCNFLPFEVASIFEKFSSKDAIVRSIGFGRAMISGGKELERIFSIDGFYGSCGVEGSKMEETAGVIDKDCTFMEGGC